MNSERLDIPRPDEWVIIRPVSDRRWQAATPKIGIDEMCRKLNAWLHQLRTYLRTRHAV